MNLNVLVYEDEAGWFIAECRSLPGCVSQGQTKQEALDNIKEAIQDWIEVENEKLQEAIDQLSSEIEGSRNVQLIPIAV